MILYFTEPLSTDMSEAAIQDALNALPVFGTEESIIVARNPTSIPTYKLTFDSHRGMLKLVINKKRKETCMSFD